MVFPEPSHSLFAGASVDNEDWCILLFNPEKSYTFIKQYFCLRFVERNSILLVVSLRSPNGNLSSHCFEFL